jgi:HSP20 family protein
MSRRGQFAPLLFASPFSLMRMLNEEMARMFTDSGAGRGSQASSGAGEVATWSPRVEAFERDGQLVVRADLPGMSKDDVDVEIADDALIIRGERRQEHEEHRDGFSVCEVTHGSFYRRIPLPEGVNTQNAAATFRDGVLEIKMQVPQREASSRRLEVQDGGRTAEQSQTQTQAAGSKS